MSSDLEENVSSKPKAAIDAAEALDASAFVCGSVSVAGDSSVTIWSGAARTTVSGSARDTLPKQNLRLTPDCPAIIGRGEGRGVPYLDPAYQPTRAVPGSGQDIMCSGVRGCGLYVSRAHFTLRMAGRGILLVNGVPQAGGGIRAPRNGTRMISPESRPLSPGEEYLIESGADIVIVLPNMAEVRISAD
jgi:hypothetical protein